MSVSNSTEEKYILCIKTVQSSNIKTLFEVLKEVLLGDVNIIFTPTNVKIAEMNDSKIAMVYLNLQSEAFEQYYCEREINVGINTTNFYKIIKIAKNSDTVSFYIERKREGVIGVKMENRDDNRVFESKVPLLDINAPIFDIPSLEYPMVISLPSSKFQKYIKDLNSLGTDCKLDIVSVGQQLTMTCRGDFSENKAVFGKSEDTGFTGQDSYEVIQGTFPLKFLILFTKATSLCQTVQIYMKNDFSLILEYCVGSLGSLRFILSPVDD